MTSFECLGHTTEQLTMGPSTTKLHVRHKWSYSIVILTYHIADILLPMSKPGSNLAISGK